jgi:hypothetical protein
LLRRFFQKKPGPTSTAPGAGHGQEDFRLGPGQHVLLFGRQLHHDMASRRERHEDAIADPEIRLAEMRFLDRLRQGESEVAGVGGVHGAMMS